MAGEARVLVRMPSDLIVEIDAAADKDRHSRNAEIIILLEEALRVREGGNK